jgi:drug/metabolite transporter (DMT)-like permease
VISRRLTPFWKGGILALLAAVAFGATTPLVQRFGKGLGPFTTAALLYAGAALSSLGWRSEKEAPVRACDAPRLLAVAVFGAALGPAALAWGLQRTGGTAASLLLNFEAVFTVVLAWVAYREPIGARVALALVAMTAGGTLLVIEGASLSSASAWGMAAVGTATLCWAADNTLTRPLADLDPARVVRWKAVLGVALSTSVALVRDESAPSRTAALGLLACGAVGYGLSLRIYLLAQRRIGAGRTGSIYAAAPFVGAVVAWLLGDRSATLATLGAAALFAAGIVLHLTEKHGHRHVHEPTEHEHTHSHDDGHHHDHVHDPPVAGEHSHMHRHEAREHEHSHAPDLHHQHEHG